MASITAAGPVAAAPIADPTQPQPQQPDTGVSVKGIFSRVMRPLTITTDSMGTFTRHMADSDIAWSRPSSTWNARDAYRNEYDSRQRLFAMMGDSAGTALPLAGLGIWAMKGMPVGGATGLAGTVAKVAVPVALGSMAALSARKVLHNAQDDGNLRGVGATVGVIGGAVAGNRFGGPVGALAGMVGGGIAGTLLGGLVKTGEGNIGKPAESDVTRGDGVVKNAVEYGRGAFTNFVEVGPISQGVAFGYKWGQRDAYNKEYTPTEQGGAMMGDLLAAGSLAAGSLALGKRLLGANSSMVATSAGQTFSKGTLGMAERLLPQSMIVNGAQAVSRNPSARAGLIGLAAGGLGLNAFMEYKRGEEGNGLFGLNGAGSAAVATGAALGGAALIAKTPFARSFGGGAGTLAASALTSTALISAFLSVRVPLSQLLNDARASREQHGGAPGAVTGIAMGAGALAGGRMGLGIASKLGSANPLVKVAGGVIGAGLGAAAGFGLSSVMPDDVGTMVKSVGGGAAIGAIAGGVLARNPKAMIGGAITGAATGAAVSPLFNNETIATLPVEDA